ncbi:GNAT family N-acetyltransferase [Cupriavidus sp. AcVe19-1a]|uniref:GNAT family N-acetyltransferase n=1 Tax=Cupriavidus sp. AcVe19-1a TaxID=2821359 RepID=UPI001AE1074E|nr:GNAT family N-acetyltransferase [Cupriavidus sp. AcVe19-1a]MBP0632618.1 GNAT family N-acetyltransferase [Cupriavidus sp. AcVe19-1a]
MPSHDINESVTYRAMTEQDVPAAHALSQALRWPHRAEDWQFVLRLGTGFVAEEAGAVIGTGLCWTQGQQASLGMIIVSSSHQGKGIGKELMRLVLEVLGDRTTLLNATPAGQPLYERLGFVATGTIHQHQGTMNAVGPVALAAGERLRPFEPRDIDAVTALANRATGMFRSELLKALLPIAETVVLERNGEAIGFSILRRFGRGHVIGPVVAPDSERAKALVAHWGAACAGSFVRVDVTGTSGLQDWLAQAGLPQVDTVVAMARNGVPQADSTLQQFALINQALC